MVPLDIEELRDSVVLGRFRAVSSLVGEAAGGPEGLGAGGGARKQEAIEIKGIKKKYKTRGKLLSIANAHAVGFLFDPSRIFLAINKAGAAVLTLCSVWGKCCSGKTHQRHRIRPHWRSRRSLAPSVRGGGCEPGRRRRCWGLTGHSLKNTHK